MLKRTVFYDAHVQASAKLIDFGGYEMPVQYEGIKVEHNAVRQAVGLFDVSHMGEVFVSGTEALKFIQKITVNDASKLSIGKAQYSAMCYENGGIVDDLLVYRMAENEYMLVINASNRDKDIEWMKSHLIDGVELEDRSDSMALLALQGPNAPELLKKLTSVDVESIAYYSFAVGECCGVSDMIISATGYTGEKGFELYFDANKTNPLEVWNRLIEEGQELGIKPSGLGARDTLRLEMGYALYGNDISESTNPLEAGLGWITKTAKDDFIGKQQILEIKEKGILRKLSGFVILNDKQVPRSHYELCNEMGENVGEVTSGGLSISLGTGVGMGYLSLEYLNTQPEFVYVSVRGKLIQAKITKPPFLKK